MKVFVLCLFSFRLTGWVLLKLFNSFFWNIQIHRGQIEMVKAATEVREDGKNPVRYISEVVSNNVCSTSLFVRVLLSQYEMRL